MSFLRFQKFSSSFKTMSPMRSVPRVTVQATLAQKRTFPARAFHANRVLRADKEASLFPPTHQGGQNQTMSETEIQQLVTNHYDQSHMPLIFSNRVYGPPYTDTSRLETLPEHVYDFHFHPQGFGDRFAIGMVEFFKVFNRLFFRDKYTHHAVVLETVAAVPGMVAGMFRHFKSLRRMERDFGWIGKLLEEAENERMHLLTWMQVIRPTFIERLVVLCAQAFYTPFYAMLYLFSPRLAHRFVGYLEETACHEYTHFLNAIDSGRIPNVDAPEIAKKYWNLAPNSKLRDVVLVVRADEAMHRDVNHNFSKKIREGLH